MKIKKALLLVILSFLWCTKDILAQNEAIVLHHSPDSCFGSSVSFNFSMNQPVESIIGWDFGDPSSGAYNTSILSNPSHIFSGVGAYTVSCIAQINCAASFPDLSNPPLIDVPCFYIDTFYTTIHIYDCESTTEEFCSIYLPNSFTPNNDLMNDVFCAYTSCNLEYFELVIFNRWGQQVFYSLDQNKYWDGRFIGFDSPIGVYVYHLIYQFSSEQKKFVTGHINLIR
jgi:gliding motility-associated-like protein